MSMNCFIYLFILLVNVVRVHWKKNNVLRNILYVCLMPHRHRKRLRRSMTDNDLVMAVLCDWPVVRRSRATCPDGRLSPSFIHQKASSPDWEHTDTECSRPEDDIRYPQDVKPPLTD